METPTSESISSSQVSSDFLNSSLIFPQFFVIIRVSVLIPLNWCWLMQNNVDLPELLVSLVLFTFPPLVGVLLRSFQAIDVFLKKKIKELCWSKFLRVF